ncbi:MAG: CBS domain-containing protein [Sandaracinaceae bacterium]|nr:CBS domain-containing protein [Sandaracinaceae bacterium]
MKPMPRVARLMTPFPYSIDANADIVSAWAMMEEHDIRHIPVTRGETVLGVVSERDLWRAQAEGRDDIDMGGLVSSGPYIVEWSASLADVAREMGTRKVGSAVVLRDGRLAGILTTTDVCEYLADVLEEHYHSPNSTDAA